MAFKRVASIRREKRRGLPVRPVGGTDPGLAVNQYYSTITLPFVLVSSTSRDLPLMVTLYLP